MKSKHKFINKDTIYCVETTGEFNISLWELGKIRRYLCPCFERQIKKEV